MGKRSRKRGDASPRSLPRPRPRPRRRRAAAAAARRSRTARSRPGTRSRSSSCACSSGSSCSCSARSTCARTAASCMLVLGMALGSLGGLDTALREHLAGYRSHTTVIASLPAVTTAAAAVLRARRRGPCWSSAPWPSSRSCSGGCGGSSCALRAGRAGRAASLYAVSDEKRMQLRGLHHVTAICRDAEATIAFYRDLLGLARRPRRPVRRRPRVPPRVVRGARRRPRAARELHAVPRAADRRGRRRLDAPLRAARGERRGAGGVARLPARPRRRVLRRLRPRREPLDLPPRSRRPHGRDRHPRARLHPAPRPP